MFFGKFYIRSYMNLLFHIRNKALVVTRDISNKNIENSLIIFVGYVPGSCWIDAGYWLGYRTWRNEESWDENFGGCAVFRHMCWFAEKKKQLFFTLNFCFLRARASTAFNFLPSSLSLAKSSDILELCSSLPEDFSTIFISLFLF